jgi:hypothetical protein
MTRKLPTVAGLALLALSALACGNTVSLSSTGSGGSTSEGCGSPPPPSGGYCPPVWECVDGDWIDLGGACPEPACPTWLPYGESCEMVGQTCELPGDLECGPGGTLTFLCTTEGWVETTPYCQPEPVCPDVAPTPGSDCSGWYEAYWCDYSLSTPCGDSWTSLHCDTSTYTWQLDQAAEACDCAALDAASCDFVSGCDWHEPGCGESPLAAGCYPELGCNLPESSPCPLDTECVEKSVDPCYGLGCNSCSAPYFVCEPSMGGA